jgi:RHS repeat-associated protein
LVETRTAANDPLPASSDVYSTTSGTNRLASITTPAGLRSISYDARGNPTSEARPAGQSVALAYDGYGRLLSYARSGEVSLTHVYNGMDDRISTTTTPAGGSADTRHFIYAPDGRVLGEYGISATDVKAEFIWLSPEVGDTSAFGGDDGLGGYMPLAVAANDNGPIGSTQLYWVHANHMGVPALYTDSNGAQVAPPTGYSAPGFPGQSRTPGLLVADLYYNRYRDYDPSTGRYIQADPIGLEGGASPYSYAMNNPLRYTDPTGEFVPILFGIAFGAGLEWLTNHCATASDIILAGALGGIGGGFGGATLLRHGAKSLTRETGKEWSHGVGRKLIKHIPWKRARKFLNQRGGYNGSWVTPKRHFKHDFYRYPKGRDASWGNKWIPAARFADRIPDWMKASAGSGAAGAGVAGDCKCK